MDPWIFDLLKTAAAVFLGFLLGRLSRRLDRKQDQKAEAAAARAEWVLLHSRGSLFTLTNNGAPARDVELVIGGGGLASPPGNVFLNGHTESFMIHHRGDGTLSIGWTDHRGESDVQTYAIPPKTS